MKNGPEKRGTKKFKRKQSASKKRKPYKKPVYIFRIGNDQDTDYFARTNNQALRIAEQKTASNHPSVILVGEYARKPDDKRPDTLIINSGLFHYPSQYWMEL